MATKINAAKYYETSAKSAENVSELFNYAAKLAMKAKKKDKSVCKLM